MSTQDIVAKLWRLCDVLRDDGITYHQYVTELTYLLFLKMAKETGAEEQLPGATAGTTWRARTASSSSTSTASCSCTSAPRPPRVQAIYANASTSLKVPKHLAKLVEDLDGLDWYEAKEEGLGNLYEGLLEKNASEKKSGAGQYFTPRPLIDSMVRLVKPQPGELVQDPAAGTCGFLIAADRYIKDATDGLSKLSGGPCSDLPDREAFYGIELVHDTHRLALMNLMLHGIEGDLLPRRHDVARDGKDLPKADVILTNPPFGTKKGGGLPTRDDFTYPTSNKQLAFLQHIYRGLKPGGRAAVVLPDNVLFEDNVGAQIRADLMDKCDLHTILRLPTGHLLRPGREDQRPVLQPRRRRTPATRRPCGSTTCGRTRRRSGSARSSGGSTSSRRVREGIRG
jgi:type I restriction enzyme M protein